MKNLKLFLVLPLLLLSTACSISNGISGPTVEPPVPASGSVLFQDDFANLASGWEAASMGLSVLSPTPSDPFLLPTADGPIDGSALVIEDGGAPPLPVGNIPAPDNGMHDLTRNQPASRRQIATFFATGQVVGECDGACLCPDHCQ